MDTQRLRERLREEGGYLPEFPTEQSAELEARHWHERTALLFPPNAVEPRIIEVDVCAYGAAPAGITAVLRAVASGRSVALITNTAHLGGLTAGGLGNTDIGNKAAIGGLARDFYRRLGNHYGVEEEWRFESERGGKDFAEMLREAGITPIFEEFASRVVMAGQRITELHFESGLVVRAKYFLDVSYEGDLMALGQGFELCGARGQ